MDDPASFELVRAVGCTARILLIMDAAGVAGMNQPVQMFLRLADHAEFIDWIRKQFDVPDADFSYAISIKLWAVQTY